jgi:hypothetical protein
MIYKYWTIFWDKDGQGGEDSSHLSEAAAQKRMAERQAFADKHGTHQMFFMLGREYESDFVFPPKSVRDRYRMFAGDKIDNGKGYSASLNLAIVDRSTDKTVFKFVRNYPATYDTFEPFYQNGHPYALISRYYTGTSVVDLERGEIIAEEPRESFGFCPVDFWVPDWWDCHDDSILPGTKFWDDEKVSKPNGQFGFVAGCVWGDDAGAWKLQYLDLSRITEGIITREERFGYVAVQTPLKDNMHYSNWDNDETITFFQERYFKLDGKALDNDKE